MFSVGLDEWLFFIIFSQLSLILTILSLLVYNFNKLKSFFKLKFFGLKGLKQKIKRKDLRLYNLLFCVLCFSTLVRIGNDNIKEEILFGTLLGDGKLEMAPRAINARFGFIQSEKNKEYFLFFL